MISDWRIKKMIDTVTARLDAIEERLTALENKRPEYVFPPVYGPIPRCPNCGQFNPGLNHNCSAIGS